MALLSTVLVRQIERQLIDSVAIKKI
jgi:hypothetical protein